jgi:ribosomal protein S18 acetylase RimI-like enzyme
MDIELPQPRDAVAVARVAQGVGVFTTDELRVVQEMLDTFLHPEPRDDHTFVVYRNGDPNSIVGFACYGPTPLADRIWDLYWICVDRTQQSNGVGSLLLDNIENEVGLRGGRAIYLETSSSPEYRPARDFYLRHGYECAARFSDFYAPGEDKVVYRKLLNTGTSQ